MLTREENEYFTRVGPGTPGGEWLRRYWHPIYPDALLRENPVRKVRILSEDLVLFRDRSGALGLVQERCPHRQTSLSCGIPETQGLRCCYHGWLFSSTGQCLEQPLEPAGSTFKDKIRITAYPVQEMGGLIWAYLGPQPAPLLPRWDLFVRPDGFRQILAHRLPCNWLQVMENRSDPAHLSYLHGRWFQYALERQGRLTADPKARYNLTMAGMDAMRARGAHPKLGVNPHEFGGTKAIVPSDASEEQPAWSLGNGPWAFPYMLLRGPGESSVRLRRFYQLGVPIDDTHTWHLQYNCYVFPEEVRAPKQDVAPYVELPLKDENGEYTLDYAVAQDVVVWTEQGPINDRTQEHLGASDVLVVKFRRLLKEQIERVRRNEDPMGVFRDPALIHSPEQRIPGNERYFSPSHSAKDIPNYDPEGLHKLSPGGSLYIEDELDKYSPDRELLLELFRRTEQILAREQTPGG